MEFYLEKVINASSKIGLFQSTESFIFLISKKWVSLHYQVKFSQLS